MRRVNIRLGFDCFGEVCEDCEVWVVELTAGCGYVTGARDAPGVAYDKRCCRPNSRGSGPQCSGII